MRTVAIVQARLGSQRFPNKILADLDGRPILAWVLERANQIAGVDAVALAMPIPGRDENDVLGRFLDVARAYRADVIVRLTADCPLLNPDVAAKTIRLFHDSGWEFVSNDTRVSGYPDGWDVEVFSIAALHRADSHAVDPLDREHVTRWMHANIMNTTLYAPAPWSGPKLSIDTPADLDVVRAWLRTYHEARRRSV